MSNTPKVPKIGGWTSDKLVKQYRVCERKIKQNRPQICDTPDKVKEREIEESQWNIPDSPNLSWKDRIRVSSNKVFIRLGVQFSGDTKRAQAAAKHIHEVYKTQDIIVVFYNAAGKHHLKIHGGSLLEVAIATGACSCEEALDIMGFATPPLSDDGSYGDWDNAMFLSSQTPPVTWKHTDAHEFGHLLGLQHRHDGGIMDYPNTCEASGVRLTASDKQRIISLYSNPLSYSSYDPRRIG